MTDNTQELDGLLLTYKSAYQIAFNEVDPHGNNMSPYDGLGAVSERSREIESEAKQAILDWHNKQIEAYHNELTDNDKKVWIYADDLERRKAKAVEEVLDRLHHEYYEVDEATLDTLIEAERTRLRGDDE